MTGEIPAGWEGILDPGERILWQGRPLGGLTLRGHNIVMMLVGAIFAAVAALFIFIGLVEGEVLFVLFPMIHLAVGLGLLFGPPFWDAYVRRKSWYTLTDRRAVIATDHWPRGRQVRSWPIGPSTPLVLVDRRVPSVHFAFDERRGKHGVIKTPVGFERVPEGAQVYALMQQIRQGAA